MLDRDSLNKALSQLSLRPNIDLLVSRLNNQFPQYVSLKPDPGAVAVDAFSLNLRYLKFYAFPPFSVMYQSNRSLNIPLGIPRALDVFCCPGGRKFDELSFPQGGAFDPY